MWGDQGFPATLHREPCSGDHVVDRLETHTERQSLCAGIEGVRGETVAGEDEFLICRLDLSIHDFSPRAGL